MEYKCQISDLERMDFSSTTALVALETAADATARKFCNVINLKIMIFDIRLQNRPVNFRHYSATVSDRHLLVCALPQGHTMLDVGGIC